MTLSGTYLVTGGAGFIGSHIAAALSASGARVRVLDDLSTGHAENLEEIGGRVEFIRASLLDADALGRALAGVEFVFHVAAIPFGPRQDPSSPYSGVISRFIAALMSGERPVIYGDGEQSRDFTYISNVVEANLRAAETTRGIGEVINVATGERATLNRLLDVLKE